MITAKIATYVPQAIRQRGISNGCVTNRIFPAALTFYHGYTCLLQMPNAKAKIGCYKHIQSSVIFYFAYIYFLL